MAVENPRYLQLKKLLADEIQLGQRPCGERMPSIREIALARSLSRSTVIHAYSLLEAEGFIEARPRSGYYVSWQGAATPVPKQGKPVINPRAVSSSQLLQEIMHQGTAFDLIHAPEAEGNQLLKRSMAWGQRQQSESEQQYYDEPAGLAVLREQIAQRMLAGGSHVSADDLVITSGCQNAMLLALMAVTRPGDIVAVESPGFYGALQLIEALHLQVVELPSSMETGLNPDAMAVALQHWPIKALITSPCFSTPAGALMSEEGKSRLLNICRDHNVTVIEDDIYGELTFDIQRPRTLYSMNPDDNVMLCSSFSKTLSRDLRLGWIAAGRHKGDVEHLKLVTSLSTSRSLQLGLSHYLQQGSYDRYLRKRRHQLRQQCLQLQQLIRDFLPVESRFSRPRGGLTLWLELPERIDTLALYHEARNHGLALAPGLLFTTQQRYQNCLRMSYQHEWTDARIEALKKLGKLTGE